VIVDTDVWSRAVLAMHQGDPRVASWRRLLLGRSVFIAAQTEAELRFWPLWRGWSAARSQLLFDALGKTPTLPVTPSVIQRYAELRASCRLLGHPMHEKIHAGDAWVAATALAYGVPLIAGDRIYRDIPGLTVLGDDDASRH